MKSVLFSFTVLFLLGSVSAQSSAYIPTNLAKDDITYMLNTFEQVHYNPYFKTSKQALYNLRDTLMRDWDSDSIPLKSFTSAGMKLAAAMSGGHSNMHWQNPAIIPEIKRYRYIPFTGKPTNNKESFVITRTSSPQLSVGTRIKAVNGISMVDLFQECMAYTGGIESYKIANTEKAFPLYLFFTGKLAPPYTLAFCDSNREVTLKDLDISALAELLNPAEIQEDYTLTFPDDDVALISYNACNDYKGFQDFLHNAFKTIALKKIDKLIIDIRENGGGDSRLNDALLSYITPKPYRQSSGRYWKVSTQAKQAYRDNEVYEQAFGKEFIQDYLNTANQEIITALDTADLTEPQRPQHFFQGTSCVLIGPGTFSSANFLADAIQTFELTTLIGAPTGEYTNDFGEQLSFTLPHTGNVVFISSTYDIGANGDATLLAPVFPDIPVEGDALSYALNWIKK